MAHMTPPRPTSSKRQTRDQALQAVADAVEAEAQAAADRLAAVAAARAYAPLAGEPEITWREITEQLGETHVNHVSAYYKDLLVVEETRTVTVAADAAERDAAARRRRRNGTP